jgi:tetratricopeptide (TPR) repeat protein
MKKRVLLLLSLALINCSTLPQTFSYALDKLQRIEEYRDQGREFWDQAKPIFQFVREVKDQKLRIRYEQAQGLFDSKKYDDAIAIYDSILNEDQDRHLARFFRAICQDELHQFTVAQTGYTECIQRDPPNRSTYLFYRGASYFKNQDYDKSKADMDAVISIAPDYGMAWDYRGSIAFVSKDYKSAKEDLKRGYELLPKRTVLGYAWALAAYRAGDFDSTEAAYSILIKQDDDDAKAWLFRGITKLVRGNRAGALQDFEETRKRRQNIARIPPHYHRVVLEMVASVDSDSSRTAFKTRSDSFAESAEYRHPTDFRTLVVRMVRGDSPIEADQVLEMARTEAQSAQVPAASRLCHAHTYLGFAYLFTSKPEQAKQEFRAAVATQATDEIEYDLAKSRLK